MLDSSEIKYTDPRTQQQRQLFAVLAARGYEAGESRGRLWRVEASPTDGRMTGFGFLLLWPVSRWLLCTTAIGRYARRSASTGPDRFQLTFANITSTRTR